MSNRLAIIVTVKIKPGAAETFRPLILENAAAAVNAEPDCHAFHVLQDAEDPDTFVFCEIYTDAAALDAHRRQPHFLKYAEAAKDLIVERTVRTCAAY